VAVDVETSPEVNKQNYCERKHLASSAAGFPNEIVQLMIPSGNIGYHEYI
jgi:hypothetical protein